MDNGEQTLRMIVLASPEPMPTLVDRSRRTAFPAAWASRKLRETEPKRASKTRSGLRSRFRRSTAVSKSTASPASARPNGDIGQASPSRSVPCVTRAEVDGRVGRGRPSQGRTRRGRGRAHKATSLVLLAAAAAVTRAGRLHRGQFSRTPFRFPASHPTFDQAAPGS